MGSVKNKSKTEAKTSKTTENTALNIAVVNEDKVVKLNDKEYKPRLALAISNGIPATSVIRR